MFSEALTQAARDLSQLLRERDQTITSVESCTGGLVAGIITALPGSSDVFHAGLITYSNAMKTQLAGVEPSTLDKHGAVSARTAIEMAQGGRERIGADYALAITGIAGPGGGNGDKPVGTVWICVAGPDSDTDCRRFVFPGDRENIRLASADSALQMAMQQIQAQIQPLHHEHERVDA
jgi:PncC family amidohydrolase